MPKRASNLTDDDVRRLHDLVNPTESDGKRHGGISRAAEYFGVSRPTIYGWLKKYPERPPNNIDLTVHLNEIKSDLDKIQSVIHDFRRSLKNYVVIDLFELKMNAEFLDRNVSRDDLVKMVLNGGLDKSRMEEKLDLLDTLVYDAFRSLSAHRVALSQNSN